MRALVASRGGFDLVARFGADGPYPLGRSGSLYRGDALALLGGGAAGHIGVWRSRQGGTRVRLLRDVAAVAAGGRVASGPRRRGARAVDLVGAGGHGAGRRRGGDRAVVRRAGGGAGRLGGRDRRGGGGGGGAGGVAASGAAAGSSRGSRRAVRPPTTRRESSPSEVQAAVEMRGGLGSRQLVQRDPMPAGCPERADRAVRDLEGCARAPIPPSPGAPSCPRDRRHETRGSADLPRHGP